MGLLSDYMSNTSRLGRAPRTGHGPQAPQQGCRAPHVSQELEEVLVTEPLSFLQGPALVNQGRGAWGPRGPGSHRGVMGPCPWAPLP